MYIFWGVLFYYCFSLTQVESTYGLIYVYYRGETPWEEKINW